MNSTKFLKLGKYIIELKTDGESLLKNLLVYHTELETHLITYSFNGKGMIRTFVYIVHVRPLTCRSEESKS